MRGNARTNVAYWRDRVERTTSRKGTESPYYSARIVFNGRRVRFRLQTGNKDEAAANAARIFKHLAQHGWAATLAKYKDGSDTVSKEGKADSVGALIEAAGKYSSARPQSMNAYVKAFRRLVAEMKRIPGDGKFDSRGDGLAEWRTRVDSVKISTLTPSLVQEWKQEFVAKAGRDAIKSRQAKITANSILRNAKALFSRKLLPFLREEIELPNPLPFDGIVSETTGSQRYRSRIDAGEILQKGMKELQEDHPEVLKILILAAVCGLRISEIDFLLWEAFDFTDAVLRVEDSEYHRLKSEDSAGEIALDDEMNRIFMAFHKVSEGEFVVESSGSISRSPGSGSYRCRNHIDFLKAWLRDNGIVARKPIHELRKEVGSVIASEQGIFAASRYLRHSDIRITSSIYADQKKRVIPSIASRLSQSS
ncbi:MAG: hypothetical protein R3F19_17845 [Verrucomicrobiales bacterium]